MAYKILLVDDEPLVLTSYRRLLNRYFEVDAASSARQGLELLENNGPYAAVIIDYLMPEMNGVDLAVEARKIAPRTSRLMLTGRGDLEIATAALNRGNILFFLAKPCSREEFLRAVTTAVETYRRPQGSVNPTDSRSQKAFLFLYQGLKSWAQKKYPKARESLQNSRAIFQELNNMDDFARAGFFLAGVIIEGDLESEAQNKANKLELLIEQTLAYYQERGFPELIYPDKNLFFPALNWAYRNNCRAEYVARILQEMEMLGPTNALLQVRTLGPLQVFFQDRPIFESDWRNPKAKKLFFFLLTRRQKKVHRDIILETFWPDMAPQAAANNFSTCLYDLRQVFGPELIVYRHKLCWLEPGLFWCDLDEFEEAINYGREKRASGQEQEALSAYSRALIFYHGDYLEEYLDEDWVLEEKNRLQELYIEALSGAAEILAKQGRYAEAGALMEEVPLLEICRGPFLPRMIDYYIQAGEEAKARKLLKSYREKCCEEVGIEPDLKLGELRG